MASGQVWTQSVWDDEVRGLGGHLLQSWRWGEFKTRHGWSVERVAVPAAGSSSPAAMAQLLFRSRGPFTMAYIPRGPVWSADDPAVPRALFDEVDRVCRRRRALYLVVEPDRGLPFTGPFKRERFVRGPHHVQPGRTVKVPLVDDEALLAGMHQKTRYSVRLAQRRGVQVERGIPDPRNAASFYELLEDTAARNEFGIHGLSYYEDFLDLFGADALLLFANVEGVRAAGLIAAKFGEEAIYMYGGSSTIHRAHGGAFLLQFEAMRWARDHGCTRYDLWGIPTEDPPTTGENGERVAGTRGDDWRGLYKFKIGFGGEIVTFPRTLERRYRPFLSFAARRAYALRG